VRGQPQFLTLEVDKEMHTPYGTGWLPYP